MRTSEWRVVLTGGPGAGKTTLVEALARDGHPVEPEAGRAVIKAQLASGGDALPWSDRLAYAYAMAAHDAEAHDRRRGATRWTFFDRGAPDVIGYLRLVGLEAPPALREAIDGRRYHRRVFLAPFWPDIYVQDAERQQSPSEARRTGAVMARVYAERGYEVTELPKADPAARVAFILDRLARDVTD